MYKYVSQLILFGPQRGIERILNQLVEKMEEKYELNAHILPVGSGKCGLVTADEKGHFDFDYNICFDVTPKKLHDEFGRSLQGLKGCVRTAFDDLAGEEFFCGNDRKSVIRFESARGNYSLDLGILLQNKDGQYCRLVYDEKQKKFLLCEAALLYDAENKETYVRQHCAWSRVELLYLRNKNAHPSVDSFHIYLETLNTAYNETGGQKMNKVSGNNHTQKQMDQYANQHNPNNTASRAAINNRANQLNPNNAAYWKSRGGK